MISKKGQSMVVQFTLFFLIGIGMFMTLGGFFRMQADNVRRSLINLSLEMVDSHISSIIVNFVGSCSNCEVIDGTIVLEKTYAGYFLNTILNESGIIIETAPRSRAFSSSINNLNESLVIVDNSVPSIKNINLTYTRNQNKLEIT